MENIVEKILKSKNYTAISPELIKKIVAVESKKFKKQDLVEKSVKAKLHTASSMFFDIKNAQHIVQAIEQNSVQENKALYQQILKMHISTRERVEFCEQMFADIKSIVGEIESICDLACGLNPVACAPFFKPKKYVAVDANKQSELILNAFFKHENINGTALTSDILSELPKGHFDVAMLFKILPLIEQQQKTSSKTLLNNLDCDYAVVTFPTKTLSNKNVGMKNKYEIDMHEYLPENSQIIFEKEYKNELLFIVKK